VNLVGIVVSVVAATVVLTVYFAPPVLGRRWEAAVIAFTGQTHEQINSGFPLRVVQWMATAIVNAVVLAYLVDRLGIRSPADGVVLGAAAWLGFAVTFAYWPVAFQNQPRAIWAINSVAFLVIQVLMGAILGTTASPAS
jgi:hypothetical protein